jgi:hypothetical protein
MKFYYSDEIRIRNSRRISYVHIGFRTLNDFDFDFLYISASWYIFMKQIPVVYQPLDDFYCVRADYVKDTSRCFFCGTTPKVKVYNQARSGSQTGPVVGTPYQAGQASSDRNRFRAFQKDATNHPAKLTVGVGAQFIRRSNYWVVTAGTYENALNGTAIPTTSNYDWAIVSAGSPEKETENGLCIPKPGIIPFYGMWMLARDGT